MSCSEMKTIYSEDQGLSRKNNISMNFLDAREIPLGLDYELF